MTDVLQAEQLTVAPLGRMAKFRASVPKEPLYPALALTAVWAIDQFDAQSVFNFFPNISASLHVSETALQYTFIPQAALGMALALMFGYLGDRRNRKRIVVAGMIIWSISIVLTGFAWALPIFIIGRLVGVAPKAPASVNQSLMADYYPSTSRGFVVSMYVTAPIWGQGLGLVIAADLVYPIWGWRWGLATLAIPGLAVAFMASRLREPKRGMQETLELGRVKPPDPVKLGLVRTARRLMAIRTFRLVAIAEALIFAGITLVGVSGSFFFATVFNVGPSGRALILILPIPLSIFLLIYVGQIGQRYLREGRSDIVLIMMAIGIAGYGTGFLIEAVAGNVWIAATAQILSQCSGYAIQAPLALLIYQIVPVGIRSQAFGFLLFCQLILPAFTVLYGGPLGSSLGNRYEIAAAFPPILLSAACIAWASRTSRQDIARSISVLAAEFETREQRDAGERVALLDVRKLEVAYGHVQVLFGVDIKVYEGETIALLGTNGAGKSTLLRAISGLMPVQNGVLVVDGEDRSGIDAETMAFHGIIYVPGGKGVFPRMTVQKNLELGGYLQWKNPEFIAERRREVLELFPRLEQRMGQLAGTLSGGEQQMLTLAQGLMSKPRLLMIDELSLGLAPVVVQELLGVIEEIKARGTTMIIVEQSVNIALALAERAYFMEKGEIRFQGLTSELLGRTDLLRSIFLEGATGVSSDAGSGATDGSGGTS